MPPNTKTYLLKIVAKIAKQDFIVTQRQTMELPEMYVNQATTAPNHLKVLKNAQLARFHTKRGLRRRVNAYHAYQVDIVNLRLQINQARCNHAVQDIIVKKKRSSALQKMERGLTKESMAHAQKVIIVQLAQQSLFLVQLADLLK